MGVGQEAQMCIFYILFSLTVFFLNYTLFSLIFLIFIHDASLLEEYHLALTSLYTLAVLVYLSGTLDPDEAHVQIIRTDNGVLTPDSIPSNQYIHHVPTLITRYQEPIPPPYEPPPDYTPY